jgi:hypothetical protein
MRLRILFVLIALAAAGCASAGQGDGGDASDTVQLTVVNEYQGTVTAYAVWGSSRIRLGDVGQNRTRLFTTSRRSDRVAVGLELIGAPPSATSVGPTPALSPYRVSESIAVVEGDAIEFRLSAGNILTVRRLEAGL